MVHWRSGSWTLVSSARLHRVLNMHARYVKAAVITVWYVMAPSDNILTAPRMYLHGGSMDYNTQLFP